MEKQLERLSRCKVCSKPSVSYSYKGWGGKDLTDFCRLCEDCLRSLSNGYDRGKEITEREMWGDLLCKNYVTN